MSASKLIYIVDDECNIRDLIKSYLVKEGYGVETFADGETVYQEFLKRPPDMLITDIMMPGINGYELCREIRKTSDVPIIFVSAKDDEIDRILGLELGSDDYISKPFSPRELVARVKNIFKRIKDGCQPQIIQTHKITYRDLVMITDERRVLVKGMEIDFTVREYDLLIYLVENKNKVFTREQMITNIWGYDYIGDTRTIDDLVKRIRKKLVSVSSEVEIATVWGYGYKLID